MFCREAVMWKRLKHPNIVRFIGATIESLQIASEFIPGGDLTSYINSNPEADRMALVSLSWAFQTDSLRFPSVA